MDDVVVDNLGKYLTITEWNILFIDNLHHSGLAKTLDERVCAYMCIMYNACGYGLTSIARQNEPRHNKTNKNECAPSEDSDQPGHPPSLIRPVWSESSLCAQWVAKDPSFLHAYSEDSDLSLRLAHTDFVGFVMSRLKCVFARQISSSVNLMSLPCEQRLVETGD